MFVVEVQKMKEEIILEHLWDGLSSCWMIFWQCSVRIFMPTFFGTFLNKRLKWIICQGYSRKLESEKWKQSCLWQIGIRRSVTLWMELTASWLDLSRREEGSWKEKRIEWEFGIFPATSASHCRGPTNTLLHTHGFVTIQKNPFTPGCTQQLTIRWFNLIGQRFNPSELDTQEHLI